MEKEIGMGEGVPEMFREIQSKKPSTDHVVELLEEIDGFNFFSWGTSEPLKVTRNGEVRFIQLKVKSVGVSEIIEEYQDKMPTPPASSKLFKKNTPEARQAGYNRDVLLQEINDADPEYQKMLRKHNNEASQMILLHGLAYDIKDESGRIVLQGSDVMRPSKIIDAQAALQALRRLGLSSEHFGSLVKSIRELTVEREEAETLE